MDKSIGNQLYEKGWKQGAYIACPDLSDALREVCWAGNPNLANDLAKELGEARNKLILLSQDCDIAAHRDDFEPGLEFVIARRLRKNSDHHPLNLDARSSRFLELNLDGNWHKAEASKILHIPKQVLFEKGDNLQPSSLNDEDVEILARWRANRYMRIALPDSFNEKIRPLVNSGLFDNGLEHAGGLYLNLDPFSEAQHYTVRLFALHRQGSSEITFSELFDKMESVLDAFNAVEGLTCPYLEGENVPFFEELMPAMRRHEVSIALRDHFVRWNFDYISLKAGDSEGIDPN